MSATSVKTGKVRFSYLNVFEAKTAPGSDKAKYSVSLLIPKSAKGTLKRINDAIQAAYEDGKAKLGNAKLSNLKTPLRDGDEERPDSPEYAGCFFINATSLRKPGVVDEDREEIIDPQDVKSGDYGRAFVNFYAFNVGTNKGIACGLTHLQKLEDGEALGGPSVSAAAAFADEEDEDLMS